jgi:hypothetical protein
MITATVSYTAQSAEEFLYIIEKLGSMKGANAPVVAQINPGVVAPRNAMGPLETAYVRLTNKSMRVRPGLDREKVAQERLINIGENPNKYLSSKTEDDTDEVTAIAPSDIPDDDVFGSLGTVDNDDDDGSVVYIAPSDEDQPF